MVEVDWTKLPEELLRMIAVRSFSAVELKRFRSICKTWRSSVSVSDKPISSRSLIKLNRLVIIVSNQQGAEQKPIFDIGAFLSRASFFRVTPSSSSSQGWLIKSNVDVNLGKLHLLNPLSRLSLPRWDESLDLLKFTITEIREAYLVMKSDSSKETVFGFKKVIIANHRVLGVCCDGKIRYWNGEIWTKIKDQMAQFCDIVVYNGLTYALDSKGIIWWINSSLNLFRYGPALDENDTNGCSKDLSLVGCCGELYIVGRLIKENTRRTNANVEYTGLTRFSSVIHDDAGYTKWVSQKEHCPEKVGFKVYKMDEELGKWVETKSLGDNAFVMATDTSFSVLAHEFYGCLPNSIYFTGGTGKEFKVFKLDDGSITTNTMLKLSDSAFQMFDPNFV